LATPASTAPDSVRLLEPLAKDLAEWRLACGRPDPDAYVFPDQDGVSEWSDNGFNKWRTRGFKDALKAAKVTAARPYDLRHSFASLLFHEGRSAVYVAKQMGNSPDLCARVYAHVIDELEDAPRLPAEDAIKAARAKSVSVLCLFEEAA